MNSEKLIFASDWREALSDEVQRLAPDSLWILTDSNVLPLIDGRIVADRQHTITVEAGESHKDLAGAERIWSRLSEGGATRNSVLAAIGGGMVTDLGGFAAATFKRGIRTVNIPTTILGAVDAAIGGKTGIDFMGLKNEIGAFHKPEAVIFDSSFFASLPHTEVLSGLGEMLKGALIDSSVPARDFIAAIPDFIDRPELLEPYVRQMAHFKLGVTERDPEERDERRLLNFGHTAGHAFESLSIERGNPLPHGCAVAIGTVTALALSCLMLGLDSAWLQMTAHAVRDNFPRFYFDCKDYNRLLALMAHDKKNMRHGVISFILLSAPGDWTSRVVPEKEIREALDLTRDLLGI